MTTSSLAALTIPVFNGVRAQRPHAYDVDAGDVPPYVGIYTKVHRGHLERLITVCTEGLPMSTVIAAEIAAEMRKPNEDIVLVYGDEYAMPDICCAHDRSCASLSFDAVDLAAALWPFHHHL